MKVLKFGGTSVGSPEVIRKTEEIVKSFDGKLGVVVSAFGGTTDRLIEVSRLAAAGDGKYLSVLETIERRHLEAVNALIPATRQSGVSANVKYLINELEEILQGVYLVKELSPKTHDFIFSFGERLSAFIISYAYKELGIDAEFVDAREVVKTNEKFGNASVDFRITNQNIVKVFEKGAPVKVITGFIGSTFSNETTTLGRGGSDYTASIVAAALDAEELQIWTDVDGMLTADPRKVEKAFKIDEISYEEAMELSYFGAKVIYPPSIQPVFQKEIITKVKNTFNPTNPGTLIRKGAPSGEHIIRGISTIGDISLVTLSGGGIVGVPGSAMRLFKALAEKEVNVILISQASSEHSISVAVKAEDGEAAQNALLSEFSFELANKLVDRLHVENGLSILAVVGKNMRKTPGIAGNLFSSLGKNGVNILAIAQGSSELNISLVINSSNEKKALNIVHESFFLSPTKEINVFISGVGLIGGTLLKQIEAQKEILASKHQIDINVVGIANSKKYLIDYENFVVGDGWKDRLEAEGETLDLNAYTDQIIDTNLPNSVFVDCTAHKVVSDQYEKLLDASISVVTPNKLACSGDYENYTNLKEIARKRDVRFLFETNVGAGLPVISTLTDLMHSGDEVLKIEAILSGSLNFIFNTVSAERSMSDVVNEAKALGFTEPDPRVDLRGMDVARKILILAREAGMEMNFDEVELKQFLPEECLNAPTVEDFFVKLEAFDAEFEKQRAAVEAEGKKYRVIATLEDGKASVELKTFDNTHGFYAAEGSDNIVLFTTNRYKELPLMIKGPGAGAEVTAAGVFADIIRIVN